jgi:hypothetical protein
MEKFEIKVWYRYVVCGEQEKEFDCHVIEAKTIQDAVNIAESYYKSHSAIPFHFSFEGIRYYPTGLTKEDMFNLTQPT